jgi:hypothetical protein
MDEWMMVRCPFRAFPELSPGGDPSGRVHELRAGIPAGHGGKWIVSDKGFVFSFLCAS